MSEAKMMTYAEFKKRYKTMSKNQLVQGLWSVSIALQKMIDKYEPKTEESSEQVVEEIKEEDSK